MLHELAPNVVHDKVAFSGGMMDAMGETVNEVIVTGAGTHAAWQEGLSGYCAFETAGAQLLFTQSYPTTGQSLSGGGTALQPPHVSSGPQVSTPVACWPQAFANLQNLAASPCVQVLVQADWQDERSEYSGFDVVATQVLPFEQS
jgi:hypothetical protein